MKTETRCGTGICGKVWEVETVGEDGVKQMVKIECPVGRLVPGLSTITIGVAACTEKRLTDPAEAAMLIRMAAGKTN